MQQFYKHKYESPKKPGTLIFVQTDNERAAAGIMVGALAKRWPAPKYFYHLASGGHLKLLHLHKHDRYFARLDIEKFFGTITRNKVSHALKKIGFSFADSESIARRSCVVVDGKRILPYGFRQSPLLASIVLDTSELGRTIRKVRGDLRLSVFMDDILLSHALSADPIENAIAELNQAATRSHFTFSVEKSQGPAALVTAFHIIMQNESLKLDADRFELFAQRVLKQGDCDSTKGILGYVQCVDQQQHNELEALAH